MERRNRNGKGGQEGEGTQPLGPEMTRIDAPKPKRGELLRDPAGGTVYKSGRMVVNVEGRELSDGLARDLGLNQYEYTVTFGANPGLKLVSLYPEPANSPGATAMRRHDKSKTASIHMGGVFKKVPELRVDSPQECTLTRGTDSKGQECIFISLQTTLDKVSGPSKTKGTQKPARGKTSQEGDAKESA